MKAVTINAGVLTVSAVAFEIFFDGIFCADSMDDTPAKMWCGAAEASILLHNWRMAGITHLGASDEPPAGLCGIFLFGVRSGLTCACLAGVLGLAGDDTGVESKPLALGVWAFLRALAGKALSKYL